MFCSRGTLQKSCCLFRGTPKRWCVELYREWGCWSRNLIPLHSGFRITVCFHISSLSHLQLYLVSAKNSCDSTGQIDSLLVPALVCRHFNFSLLVCAKTQLCYPSLRSVVTSYLLSFVPLSLSLWFIPCLILCTIISMKFQSVKVSLFSITEGHWTNIQWLSEEQVNKWWTNEAVWR